MKKILYFTVLLITLAIYQSGYTQVDYTFWFVAPEVTSQHGDDPIGIKLTSFNQASQATISMPAVPAFVPIVVNINANQTVNVDLTPFKNIIENLPPNQILNRGILVESTNPVTCYYEVNRQNNPDIFTLKGENALDTTFFIPSQTSFPNGNYNPVARNAFDIVATEDNTVVTIIPAQDIVGHAAGVPFTITLDRGQTYSATALTATAAGHLAGSRVFSNKKIAITIKDDSVAPGGTWGGCRDLMGDQIIGLRNIGTEYIIVRGPALNNNTDHIYVLATQNNTDIFIDGSALPVATLNAGQTYVYNTINAPRAYIQTSAPVYVLHVAGFGCELGQAVIPPIGCSGSTEVAFTRSDANANTTFSLILFTKNGGQNTFTLNGNPLTPGQIALFDTVPGTNGVWVSASINLTTVVPTAGTQSLISNSTEIFHAGIINGGASTGCRYGYFSGFTTIQLGRDRPFCVGDTVILDAGVGKDSYLWSTGDTTRFLTVTDSGEYYVYATIAQCNIYDTVHLSHYPRPDTNLRDTSICAGTSITISAAQNQGYSYLWNNNSTNATRTVNTAGQYYVDVTDSNLCVIRDSMVLSIDTLPIAIADFNPFPTQCVQNPTFLLTGNAPPVGVMAYWSGVGVVDSSGIFDPAVAGAGTHALYYTFIDTTTPGLCSSTDTSSISVIPFVLTANDTSVCTSAAPFQISHFPSGGTWLPPFSGNVDTTNNQANGYIIYDPGIALAPRIDTLIYEFSNLFGCTNRDTTIVEVFVDAPTAFISDTFCADQQLVNSKTINLSNYDSLFQQNLPVTVSYYSNAARTNLIGTPTQHLVNNNDTVFVGTSIGGQCPNNQGYIAFIIDSLPTVQLGNDTTLCVGESFVLNGSPNIPYQLTWNDSSTALTKTVSQGGTYSLNKVNTITGCQSADTIVVTAANLPNLNLGNDTNICANNLPLTLNAVNQANHTYLWNTAAITANISVNQTGQYWVTKTNTITNCSISDTFNLTVDTLPVVALGSDTTICNGDTILLSTGLDTLSFFFLWSNGATNPSLNVSQAGTYRVTAENATTLCIGADTIIVSINTDPPVALCRDTTLYLDTSGIITIDSTVVDSGSFDICGIFTMQLSQSTFTCTDTGVNIVIMTVTDVDSYTSSCTSLITIVDTIPPVIVCPSNIVQANDSGSCDAQITIPQATANDTCGIASIINSYNLTNNASDIYPVDTTHIIWTATDHNGNTASCSMYVVVQDTELPTIVCPPNIYIGICTDTVNYAVPVGVDNCPGAITSLTSGIGNNMPFPVGTHTETYTVTDSAGNFASCSFIVDVAPLPPINIGNDTAICPNTPFNIILDADTNAVSYLWNTGATTDTIHVNALGTYWIQITDTNNCNNSDTILIQQRVPIVPVIGAGPSPFCPFPGNTLVLPAAFTNPVWSTGDSTQTITVDTTGTYTVSALDIHGCETSGSISVTSRPRIWPNLPDTVNRCFNDSVFLFAGGIGFTNFLWSTGAQTNAIIVNTNGTYWVSTTDSSGCNGFDSVYIGNYIHIPADLGPDTAICNGEFVPLSPGNFAAYQWNDNDTSSLKMAHTQGGYAVTVIDANGCSSSDSMYLIVHDLLNFSITGNQPVCPGFSQTLRTQNHFVSYSWSTGAVIDSIVVSTPGSYSVTTIDSNGCIYAGLVNFNNFPNPSVNLGADDTLCVGQNKILNAGAGFVTYSWTPAHNQQLRTVTTSGTYSVTVIDNNGCTASDVISLYFDPGPTVSLGPDIAFCIGDTATLSTTSPFPTYNWSNGLSTPTITVTQAGQYSITVTDSITGCPGRDTMNVVTYSLPNVNIGADIYYCTGTSFTQAINGGNGFASYTWMTGATSQIISVNQNIDTVWVSVVDNNGCENSDTLLILQNQLPTVNLGADDTLCAGQSKVVNAGTSGGTITNYSWNNGQTTQNRTYQAPINLLTPTTVTWSVTVTDFNGCQASDSISISAFPLPRPSLGRDTAYCIGSPFSMTITPGAYSNYAWNTGDTTASITVFGVDSLYSVTVTDANGCAGESNIKVSENPLPNPNLGPDSAYCDGYPFVMVLSPGGFVQYQWSNGATTPILLINSAGTYSVTVIDNNGCENNDDITINVLPRPSVNLGQDMVLCEDSIFAITLDASTLVPPTGISYNWNTGSTSSTIQATNFGNYSVTISENVNGCSDSSSIRISPFGLVSPNLGPDSMICSGEAIILNSGITQNGYSFLWNTGETSRTITIDKPGNYWVELNALNGTCNGIRDSVFYVLGTMPIVELGENLIICRGSQVVFLDNRTTYTDANYFWQDTIPGARFVVTRSGDYRVKATNKCGTATDEVRVDFADCDNLFIPNAFTPNGDGRNDFFRAETEMLMIEYTMLIYDRWGNIVFKTNNVEAYWDGKYNGNEDLPIGVYSYKITYVSAYDPLFERREQIGSVHLIR